ncbi:GNAT family N-acetyltransferase [Fulvimonas yonginensis]|uniref:GNAT family N-acetyltransferase n=1 Tax=Fulvimonas yonginensis TaxID=1495200 RepID=A0ABU8J848_9GAMM
MILVRAAADLDAARAVDVVRRSIADLCRRDPCLGPDTLQRWLANKTPENFLAWIAHAQSYCAVGEIDGIPAGVGLLRRSGEIQLFYVAPEAQRQGLGRAIHDAVEAQARHWNLDGLHLCSTTLARPFYEALGYRACGPERRLFGELRCHPYRKPLERI